MCQNLLDEGCPVVEGVLALLQQELDPGGEGSHHGGGGLQVPAVQRPGPRQPRQRTSDNVLRVLLADLKYFYMKIYFTTKYFFLSNEFFPTWTSRLVMGTDLQSLMSGCGVAQAAGEAASSPRSQLHLARPVAPLGQGWIMTWPPRVGRHPRLRAEVGGQNSAASPSPTAASASSVLMMVV